VKADDITWPCELPSSIRNLLQTSATKRSFDIGEHFLMGQGAENGLCFLSHGVMVLGINSFEKSSPFAIFKRGDWFGGSTFIRDPDFLYRIAAIEPSTVCFFPDRMLREAAGRHLEIYKLLFLATTNHTNDAIDLLFASTGMTQGQKVAYFLLKIARSFPQVAGTAPVIPISQTALAQLLGLSRLTLNQQLHALVQIGIIEIRRRKVFIMNMKALEALAGVEKTTA
jgi:CRP-like cAMP-binding protein